jgi:NAD-dependent DNA ligase
LALLETEAPVAAAAPASPPAPVAEPVKPHNPNPPVAPQATPAAQPSVAAAAPGTRTLCISGKLHSGKKKADYEAPLRAVGIDLVDDVSKGLSYLVLADPDSTSSKADKARKLGVSVISEDQLLALLGRFNSNVD